MNKKDIAINGGRKVRTVPFPAQPGPEFEAQYVNAVERVLQSQILSGFRGNSSPAFYGGSEVQEFEKEVEKKFNTKYAVACNSATSGLHMACAAIGLKPGDEVIVSPWSMSCSATAPLAFGAIPVFADIEPETFCLDPEDVETKITDRTKAIIAVDLFGQPFSPELLKIAEENNLYIIEDAAQAIGSTIEIGGKNRYAGTLGHIGVFSFTQGKHLTAGEGGCCITDDTDLALRLRLMRNHSEAVLKEMPEQLQFEHSDLCGQNLRMTEMQAAILQVELKRLDSYIEARKKNAQAIFNAVCVISFGSEHPASVRFRDTPWESHSFYVLPLRILGCNTKEIAEALRAELMPDEIRIDRGVPIANGYIDPLYLMPIFQLEKHWAFTLKENFEHHGYYEKGCCPVAERLTENGLLITLLHGLALSEKDLEDVCEAFRKVFTSYEQK